MPRAMWSGSINFGLISLPVKAYPAVSRERIDFDMLHDEDGGRIEYRRVCSVDGEEVPWEHVVKGYAVSEGRYVTFTNEELEALRPEATKSIDIEDFVLLEQIDPMYYDSPYYVLPEPGAARAYRLLHTAMTDAGVVAIARVVLRTRQRLVAIRPLANGDLAMETMHFSAEVREVPERADDGRASTPVSKREATMARTLIDELTIEFDPTRYHDTYRERLLEQIEAKSEGAVLEAPERGDTPATPTGDIMAALEASLEAAKARRANSSVARPRAKRTAAAAARPRATSTRRGAKR